MKLIIQIPCYNEEKTLPITLKELPKEIPGIEKIEILIIDDGSIDKTVSVAKANNVDHILCLPKRSGLAEAFKRGIEKSLELGADIIVNTDGDNQYCGQDIGKLIKPVLGKKAEVVIGCRDIEAIRHFSLAKRILQKFGSYMVRKFSGTAIPDTTSGFRAYSRDAALRLNIFSSYTYTLETIIQMGRQDIPITHIDIKTNSKLRESRLVKSMSSYITRSVSTILRIYLMYEPLKAFLRIGSAFLLMASILILRFLYFHFTIGRSGRVQSLVLAAILVVIGFGIILLGFLGDIISANRRLSEEVLYRLKKRSY